MVVGRLAGCWAGEGGRGSGKAEGEGGRKERERTKGGLLL